MGSTSPKPFQISLSDIIEKYDVIQLVVVVKSLLKITATSKSQMMKNIVPKVLTLLTEFFYNVSCCS